MLGFLKCKAAKVFAVERNKEDLDKLVAETPQEFGTIVPILVDLCDWDAAKAAIEKIETVDVLVNNAGVFIEEPFGSVTPSAFDT